MPVEPARKLDKLPPYLFADLRRKRAAAIERGVDVINLSIGDPDQPTPGPIVAEMCRAIQDASDPNRHRYGCDVPVPQFAEAARDFYRRRYGVELGPDQVVPTMGGKDAIVKLALSLLNPGDLAIAPSPGYPTYNIGHVFSGAVTYQAPLLAENDFLVDFDAIPHEARRLARVLWLNYPNNPTTATADLAFFEGAVEFARRYDILIVHDNAYGENTFDGYRAPSILQVEGAADVAVELFSLSKAFSMTGWRVAFLAGNATAVRALQTSKENVDNGTLRAVQFAAAKALDMAEELIPPINAVYQRRRDMVVDALNAAGWSLKKPKATMYVWAPVPDGYEGSSAAFATDLLERTGVVVSPGLGFGQWGEGFFRISLTYPDDSIRKALSRITEGRL